MDDAEEEQRTHERRFAPHIAMALLEYRVKQLELDVGRLGSLVELLPEKIERALDKKLDEKGKLGRTFTDRVIQILTLVLAGASVAAVAVFHH